MYIDGSIEQAVYTHKKQELLLEKTSIKERIRRVEREGSSWLGPLDKFLKDAIFVETTVLSGTEQELRNFHRRIGWSTGASSRMPALIGSSDTVRKPAPDRGP